MKVGFTGTQQGMTPEQQFQVGELLRGEDELHHGDCVGADEQAHGLALLLKVPVVRHPPSDNKKRASCEGGKYVEPRPYLERNRDIVNATDALFATPSGSEVRRSGTWSTVRFARLRGKPVFIIMPDGRVV